MQTVYEPTEGTVTEDAKSELLAEPESQMPDGVASEAKEESAEPAEQMPDYEQIIRSDVETLKAEFPELKEINDITDLNNPLRYAALRDLGLSPAEAYMATAKRRSQDTRSHLRSAHGRSAAAAMNIMSQRELSAARELFPGMSDSELQRLYKRVTN